MKTLDIESLDLDTNECTAFLVKQWTNDVQFDAVFDKKQLEYFFHSKVRPMVFDVLSCDTPMDYTDVKVLRLEKRSSDLPVQRLTSWGDTQFKNALHERLKDLKHEVTQRWSVEQILKDIDATFVVLQHKVEFENNVLQGSKTIFINKARDRRLEQADYTSYNDQNSSPHL